MPLWELGVKVRSGPGQWLSEGVATFTLMLAILGGVRHKPEWVPAIVAAVITAGYWFTGSTSFANPAITLARALTDSFRASGRSTRRRSSPLSSLALTWPQHVPISCLETLFAACFDDRNQPCERNRPRCYGRWRIDILLL